MSIRDPAHAGNHIFKFVLIADLCVKPYIVSICNCKRAVYMFTGSFLRLVKQRTRRQSKIIYAHRTIAVGRHNLPDIIKMMQR